MSVQVSHDSEFLTLQQALAGRYSLDRELGRGGMGVVYLAHEVRLDRLVAIKLLPPTVAADPIARERFLSEARTAARLAHPHIVPIHAVEVVGDFVFYVMGYVDGESLAQRISSRGPLPAREGARLLRETAWALAHAHTQGVVHRDIKPDNILIERESGRAVVVDFGIAAAIGTTSDSAIGTPAFMSPEQVLGQELDARSDLYALGVTAFYAFSGRVPFEGPDLTTLARHVSEPAPLLTATGLTLPRYIVQLVAQCLAKSPDDRPRDAQQVTELLDKGLATRRELPAVLRAFVKRDGRADGLGTVVTIFGISLLGAVLTVNFGGLAYPVTLALALPPAASAFFLRGAYRLARAGYTHADVAAAFDAEVENLRDEQHTANRPWLRRLQQVTGVGARAGLGAATLIAITTLLSGERPVDDSVVALFTVIASVSVFLSLLCVMAIIAQREDVSFWQKLWCGRIGRLGFAVARRLGATSRAPVAVTHRATELSLSLAAEQLFDALPAQVRRPLQRVPRVLDQLQRSSATLRARLGTLEELRMSSMSGETLESLNAERERVALKLHDAVGALESIRLDLLRLHAGVSTLDGVTTNLAHAEAINNEIERQLAARREVEAVLDESVVPGHKQPSRIAMTPYPEMS